MEGSTLPWRWLLNFRNHGYAICLTLVLVYPGYGQIFKTIGVRPGVSFTPLEWEYRYSGREPASTRRSEEQPVGFHVYLTTEIASKRIWAIHSSLGWIVKKGRFTETGDRPVSVPYRLNYISWINSVKSSVRAGKRLSVNVSLGPRLEYLLTPWDDIPGFAPNNDAYFYFHSKEDVRKFVAGLTGGTGLSWHIKDVMLQLSGWMNLNFNPVIRADGRRADGIGDNDAYFVMTDRSYGVSLELAFLLTD